MKRGDKVKSLISGNTGVITLITSQRYVHWTRDNDGGDCLLHETEMELIEEEKAMTKTYTGLKAIEKMTEREFITRKGGNSQAFTMKEGQLKRRDSKGKLIRSEVALNYFFEYEFEVYDIRVEHFKKHNRELNQFRIGDLVVDGVGMIAEVTGVGNQTVQCKVVNEDRATTLLTHKIEIYVPAEVIR